MSALVDEGQGLSLRRAGELADKPALIDGPSDRTISYARLAALVERAAAGLAARGFGAGDVLALYAPTFPSTPWPRLRPSQEGAR